MLSLSKQINVPTLNRLSILEQQLRHIRTRKPPWIPRSKAKAFRVPPMPVVDMEEKLYMDDIQRNWRSQMRSVYQLLKTEAKFSDKASLAAQEEKRKELEQEKLLLAENEARNKEILAVQLREIEANIEREKLAIERRLAEKREKEAMYVQMAEEKVRALKEKAKSFIDPNNLEFEIEKMLNERHDYNFAINAQGSLFRNSQKVTRAQAFDTNYFQDELIAKNVAPAEQKAIS